MSWRKLDPLPKLAGTESVASRLTLYEAEVLPVLVTVELDSETSNRLVFEISGLEMSGFEMSGLEMSGFEMSGLLMSGLKISGFEMSGFSAIEPCAPPGSTLPVERSSSCRLEETEA